MKYQLAALTVFLSCLFAIAEEEGRFKFEYPGYTNTPMIPESTFRVHQKDRPQPPRVIPPKATDKEWAKAPADAKVLFDGKNLDQFNKSRWKIKDGVLVAGGGFLTTKSSFGDCRMHVEWKAPNPPGGKPSSMGNSGVFFMQVYELQVFDSYSCKIYADGSAAAIYGQTPPLANACRKPGEWQSYDITFKAPVFKEGKLIEPARITVLHNGILVQKNTKIHGPTAHKSTRPYKAHDARLPLRFQGHGSPVEYRNIWIRELK